MTRRYHDLDALRGILMIWGIAVHASTLRLAPVLQEVARTSGFVRMEAFMAISGLLTAMLIERRGQLPTMRKRAISLGLPLIVGLLLLNPVANWLAYCFHNGFISWADYLTGSGLPDAVGPMTWHLHLWFLISLLGYAVLTPLLSRVVDAHLAVFHGLIRDASPTVRFLGLCTLVPAACLLSRLFFEFFLEAHLAEPLIFLVRATLFYLPFFALGLLLYRSPLLLEAFSRIHPVHVLLAATAVALSHGLYSALPRLTAETAELLSESYLATALSGTLFAIARRLFTRKSGWTTFFADASYSIYLLHFLVIYVLAIWLRPVFGAGPLLALVVIVGTFAITAVLHQYVIRPVPLLRLLLNGRPPVKPVAEDRVEVKEVSAPIPPATV